MILLLTILREMRSHSVLLLFHALALGGAFFVAAVYLALLGSALQREAPGTASGDRLRLLDLALRDDAHAREVAELVREATRLQVAVVRGISGHSNAQYGGVEVFSAPARFFDWAQIALDVEAQRSWQQDPEAVIATAGLLRHAQTSQLSQLELLRAPDDFFGLGHRGSRALWIRDESAEALRLPPFDYLDWKPHLWLHSPDAGWIRAEAELNRLRGEHPESMGELSEQIFVYASGRSPQSLRRGVRPLLLIGTIAVGAILLAFVNLGLYFRARGPMFGKLLATLRGLGLRRRLAYAICVVEPCLVSLLAAAVALAMAQFYMHRSQMAIAPPWALVAGCFAAVILPAAAWLGWQRLGSTSPSFRPGVLGFRRRSANGGGTLILLFAVTTLPVIALAAQSSLAWMSVAQHAALPIERIVWVGRWQRDSPLTSAEFARLAELAESADTALAVTSGPAPLFFDIESSDHSRIEIGDAPQHALVNRVSPRFLWQVAALRGNHELAKRVADRVEGDWLLHGGAPLQGEAWLIREGGERKRFEVLGCFGVYDETAERVRAGAPVPVLLDRNSISTELDAGMVFVFSPTNPVARAERAASILNARLVSVRELGAEIRRGISGVREQASTASLVAVGISLIMVVGFISLVRLLVAATRLECAVKYALGMSRWQAALDFARGLARRSLMACAVGFGVAALAVTVFVNYRPLTVEFAGLALLLAAAIYLLFSGVLCAWAAFTLQSQHNCTFLRSEG